MRRKGIETPPPPKVSRYSGVKVTKIASQDANKKNGFFAVRVTFAFAPSIANQKTDSKAFMAQIKDTYLTDKKGNLYRSIACWQVSDPNQPDDGSNPTPTFVFNSWETLPTNLSDLTFHTKISVNDFWPLEINIPVKEMPTFQ